MANPQPNNVWQNVSRARQNATRTPQNRSSTASPIPPNSGHASPKQDSSSNPTSNNNNNASRPQTSTSGSNVWTQRNASSVNASASTSGQQQQQQQAPQAQRSTQEAGTHVPLHGFNGMELLTFLARDSVPHAQVYRLGSSDSQEPVRDIHAGTWKAKANHTAANQPFFAQCAEQIAILEGGG